MRPLKRLLLAALGASGLYVVSVALNVLRTGAVSPEIPTQFVLFVVAFAGLTFGFLWIRKIANDVGKV